MHAADFIRSLRAASFSPFMGVPCSVFTPLIDHLTVAAAADVVQYQWPTASTC